MKNNIISFMILSIIILTFNLFFQISLQLYIFGVVFILLLLVIAINKKLGLFLIVSLMFFYFTFGFVIENFSVIRIVSTLIFLAYYNYCFKYAFNLFNNKMNIQFKNLQIPDDKDFLIVKYVNGPLEDFNSKGMIVKEDDGFILYIENKNKIVKSFKFLFNQIELINVNEKPYMKPTTMYGDYNVDYMKSSAIGKITGDFDEYKSFKFIRSYEISIKLKDNSIINITSFDNPDILKN